MIQEQITTPTCGPALQKMIQAFPLAKEKTNGWWAHPDNPKFDFRENEDGSLSIHSWTGRSRDDILRTGGLQITDIYPKGYKTVKVRDSLGIVDLSHAKLIPWEFLTNLGLQDGYVYKGRRYVKVPYHHADGSQHTKIKVRKAIDGLYKQVWDDGTPGEIIPYGLNKLDMARDAGYLLIGEGESDAWTCWYHNVPYLGIPGSDFQKCLKRVDPQLLPAKIYILLEADQKTRLLSDGTGFYRNIHSALRTMGYQGEIFCIDFKKSTDHKDPSDLHIALCKESQAKAFNEIIGKAMGQALPANDTQEETATFVIQDKRVLNALIDHKLQDLYVLAPDIADMEEMEQDRIRLAAHDVWKKDFPMREFNGLLRSAKEDNERKKMTKPVIFSVTDLMQKVFPPIDYVVPDILPVGLIVLAGKQKIGKSWIDLNLALAVASGGIAFGKHRVKQGNVLYMALEDNERRLQDRVKVLTPEGSQVPEALDLVTSWPRMDADGISLLEQWIISHPNARLVIIDPWVMVKPRVKSRHGETGYDAEYEAFKGIKELADKYEICILVQFHLRKAVADDYVDTINATTGVTACADGFLVLQRLRGEEGASLRGTGRDFKEDVDLVMNFKGGIWSIPGDANPEYYKLNAERRAVIDILNEAAGPMEPHDIANLLHIRQDTMRQLLKKMKDNDQVEDTGKGYVSLISTTPSKDNPFPGWKESKSDHADHASHDDHITHADHALEPDSIEPIESTNGTGVIGVTSVTSVINDSTEKSGDGKTPLPLSLLQEYKDLYKQLREVPREALAPHESLMWNVPDSGITNEMVTIEEYCRRLLDLAKSKSLRKVRSGIEEMQRKLGQLR